jgi:hypothetical protein
MHCFEFLRLQEGRCKLQRAKKEKAGYPSTATFDLLENKQPETKWFTGLPLSSSLISLELLRCLLQGIHTFLDCPGGTMQPQNDMVLRAEWFHLISEISLGVVELR